jgi:hypothetical protein
MIKSFRTLFSVSALGCVSLGANAMSIVDNTAAGYFNGGLGTLLDTSGFSDPFPCANVACGDSSLSFASAPNLAAAAAQLGSWLINAPPSGGAWSATAQAIPGTWAVNTETAIVYAIDAGNGLTNVNLSLGVDNGIFVWLNGSYLFGARAGGGSTLGEYTRVLPDLVGFNYLQILREDHGGGTGYDILLSADRVVVVPEPMSIGLLSLGLLGIASVRRRTRTDQ